MKLQLHADYYSYFHAFGKTDLFMTKVILYVYKFRYSVICRRMLLSCKLPKNRRRIFSSIMNNYNLTIRITYLTFIGLVKFLHLFKNHTIKLYALVTSALVLVLYKVYKVTA